MNAIAVVRENGDGMAAADKTSSEQAILLGLLDAVERGDVTQRRLSSELGIAVGLVNTYVKRCIKKGLIKVQEIPPRRYAYYLTPNGFLEKSRLIGSYFVHSFDFFRRARSSCATTLSAASAEGFKRIGLVGASELTEIAVIVATELDVNIVAVIDAGTSKARFLGIPVIAMLKEASEKVDAVMITDLSEPQRAYEATVVSLGKKRVYMPSILANVVISKSRSRAAKGRVRK